MFDYTKNTGGLPHHYQKPADFHGISFPKLGLPDSFLVIDTETTGFGKFDEVVELSVLSSCGDELYHSYFMPSREVHPDAQKVTGLSRSRLYGQPRFTDEWSTIRSILDGNMLAGHNIGFDKRMLMQTLAKNDMYGEALACGKMFEPCIDSCAISRRYDMGLSSRALGAVCGHIGVSVPPDHTASHDCLGVLYLLQNMEMTDYPLKSMKKQPVSVRHPDAEFGE